MSSNSISVVIPSHDCDNSINATIDSVLNQSIPVYELIIVPNGSEEHNRKIVAAIKSKHRLISCEPRVSRKPYVPFEEPYAYFAGICKGKNKDVYTRLLIICKTFGNKADALNSAMFYSTGKYLVTVDADTILSKHCLRELYNVAMVNKNIVAIGGLVYPMRLNPTILSAFQLMEYETSFLIARRFFNMLNCTMLLSGALSMFRKDVLNAAGGFRTDTVGEDMEVTVRLQKLACEYHTPYKIQYTPKAVCFTVIPQNFGALFRQRMRWHMGLMEVLWIHKEMFFNIKHGIRGLLAMPYLLFVELLSAFIVLIGAIITGILYWANVYSLQGIIIPITVMVALYESLMLLTYMLHIKHFEKRSRLSGKLLCVFIGLIAIFIYRPLLNIAKIKAMLWYKKYKGKWLRSR